jgi:hypothetical protein
MRMMRTIAMIVPALFTCLGTFAFAQPRTSQSYQTPPLIALEGAVEKVINVTSGQGWYGVHLMLQAKDHTYDVRLGPSDFIAQSNFTFAPGDAVQVWGTQTTANGSSAIIARAIEKNGQTLTLRDADGFPVWAGTGMRSGNAYGDGRDCPGGCGGHWHHGCGCHGGCGHE